MMFAFRPGLGAVALALFAPAALACGPDTDCVIGERSYRISMPQGNDGQKPVGAVIWAHGYRGSADGVMQNTAMRHALSQMNLALIAAQGIGGTWDLPNGPRTMDSTGAAEFAYFENVIEDATSRFAIDRDRIHASGFSAGGMMVWNLACGRPDLFAGFAPFSGTFWLEPPDTCAEPVRSLVHIHGTEDITVPLEGRAIAETKQGEVADALTLYAAHGRFGAAEMADSGTLACETRTDGAGHILSLCLFEGGHSFSVQHLKYAIGQLETNR